MIRTIDAITINGSRQVWNGYIFNLNYQPSFGGSPSFCTASFVSEDGTYSITENDLQVITPHTIQIGKNKTLSMFPVNFKKDNKSSGKILEVRYIDTSIILDKRNVVLNGRQGNDGTAFPINPYGTGPKKYSNDEFSGSCYIPIGQQLIVEGQTYNDVLDVVYTFTQLCEAIANNGIIINQDSYALIQNSNQFYYSSYIGSLRTVLSQWCTDLGYGFYWEDNSIHFLDLTTPLILNTSSFDSAVQEANTEEASIEDTVGRVASAFYGQDRQLLNPSPGQDTQITLNCVTMSQVGLSQDQIHSIIAAFMGEDFYISYHLLLNSNYGNKTLGITARTDLVDFAQTPTGDAFLPKNSDGSQIYNKYVYVAQDLPTYQSNWEFYKDLTDQIGKYYFLPINWGSAKLMSQWEFGKPEFRDGNLSCAETSLGTFSNILGATNEKLNQFLIGTPYTDNDADSAIEAYSKLIQAEIEANPNITVNAYDSTEGYLIADVGKVSWQIDLNLDNNFVNVSAENISQFIIQNNLNSYYSYPVGTVSSANVVTILNTDQPANYQNIINAEKGVVIPFAAPQLKMYAIQQAIPGGGSFNLDGWIKTPEDIYPVIQPNVYIANISMNIQSQVEEFFRSEKDKTGTVVNCNSNVIKNELNFRQITREDLLALGSLTEGFASGIFTAYGIHLAIPALPSPTTLEQAFVDFTQNLTWSKVTPTIVKTYTLPYIDLPDNYQPLIGKGLINLNISISDKGIESDYTMGTRLMQIPSIESIRRNIEFQRGTNQSRFLPYGFQPLATL